jgi:hypothetical protein
MKTWEMARSIGEHWGLVTHEHALPESEIEAAEKRLGFRLPAILREWYLWAGKHAHFCGRDDGDYCWPLEELWVLYDHLLFGTERDGVVAFGIAQADFEQPDPIIKTTGDFDPEDDPQNEWGETDTTLSGFFRDQLLQGALEQHAHNKPVILAADALGRLRSAYSPIHPAVTWPIWWEQDIYLGEEILLAFQDPGKVWVATLSQAARQRFCELAEIKELL